MTEDQRRPTRLRAELVAAIVAEVTQNLKNKRKPGAVAAAPFVPRLNRTRGRPAALRPVPGVLAAAVAKKRLATEGLGLS